MKIPTINTTNGKKPVTVLPNEHIVSGFLASSSSDADVSMVRLLAYAEPNEKKAGALLRRCLSSARSLVAVYPAQNETPPAKATLIGSIPDGALYLV